MMRLALVFALVLASASAGATVWYVSNSTANGWSLGSDAASGLTTGAPKLTFSGAQSSASNGDTIIFNDGTYSPASITVTKSVSLVPLHDYAVTLTSSDASRTVYVTASDVTIGALIIDTNGVGGSGVQTDNATRTGLVLDGTRIVADGNYGLYVHFGVTLSGEWSIKTPAGESLATAAIYLSTGGVGSVYTISGGEIDVVLDEGIGIQANVSVAGAALSVSGTAISVATVSSGQIGRLIYSSGCETVSISGVVGRVDVSSIPFGVSVPSRLGAAVSASVSGNTLTASAINPSGGGGIMIGDDSNPADDHTISGAVEGNTITGFNHGIMLGFVTEASAKRNLVRDVTIGIISKNSIRSLIAGNIILGGALSGGALRSKGDTDSTFTNNTVVLDAAGGVGYLGQENPDTSTGSTGVSVKNNAVYASANVVMVSVNVGSDASFESNDWHSPSGLVFTYQGASYTAVAAWNATAAARADIDADPLFLAPAGTTAESFKTRSGSPLRRAGIPISPNYTLRDYRNCRFDIPPTIGAFEVCAGDAP